MDGLPIPLVDGKPVVSLEGEELLDVEVLYDEIREDGIGSETFHQVIRVKATQDPAEVKPNGEVITWTSIQQSGKTLAEAQAEVKRGLEMVEFACSIPSLNRALLSFRLRPKISNSMGRNARAKPHSSRPPEMASSMPISPAILSGLLKIGSTAPVTRRAFFVRWQAADRKMWGLGE